MSQSPENISSIIPIALDKGDRKIKGNDPNHIIDGVKYPFFRGGILRYVIDNIYS
jgi:hypothetical protein